MSSSEIDTEGTFARDAETLRSIGEELAATADEVEEADDEEDDEDFDEEDFDK